MLAKSKLILLNENGCSLIHIVLKFVPMDPTDNKLALVQIMAWHWRDIIRNNYAMVYRCIYSYLQGY